MEKQATLERQLEQQRQQLKAVAPDEKRLAQLERGVAANKQGESGRHGGVGTTRRGPLWCGVQGAYVRQS